MGPFDGLGHSALAALSLGCGGVGQYLWIVGLVGISFVGLWSAKDVERGVGD